MRCLPRHGFTMVETLVATAILLILFGAIATIIQTALVSVGTDRVRTVATTLAQEQLELARNLPYSDVGTVGGIPPGSLEQEEIVMVNGQNFTINTSVVYIDDDFDDVAPTDTLPIDYKRVRVEVTWDGVYENTEPIIMLSDIAPRGLETQAGLGTLNILVFDADAAPVSGAKVKIKATTVIPEVDLEIFTDAAGVVFLPGAPVCSDNCYEISVTKTGYTSDRTYGTNEVANPHKGHLNVVEGQISDVSFSIDLPSTVAFKTVRNAAQNYGPFPQVQLRVHGSKEIGRTATDDPVYLYDELITTTGITAEKYVNDLVWDTYHVDLPEGSILDFAGSWPFSPLILPPGFFTPMTVVVEGQTPHSLLVYVKNEYGGPVNSGEVEIRHDLTSFIATKSTPIDGDPDWSQAFFPSLNSDIYDLRINSTGYYEATASVSILGDKREIFLMEPL